MAINSTGGEGGVRVKVTISTGTQPGFKTVSVEVTLAERLKVRRPDLYELCEQELLGSEADKLARQIVRALGLPESGVIDETAPATAVPPRK